MSEDRCTVTIYALIAELNTGTAAYIGQTVSFERRMREHCKMREGKAATLLLKQAEAEGRTVRALVLETADNLSDADTAEGAWIWKAQEEGITLMALDGWFQRKHSTQRLATAKIWPDSATIALKAKPVHAYSKEEVRHERARRKSLEELDDL